MKVIPVAAILGLFISLFSFTIHAEERTRNCPPGTPRDPQGYCRPSSQSSTPSRAQRARRPPTHSRQPAANPIEPSTTSAPNDVQPATTPQPAAPQSSATLAVQPSPTTFLPPESPAPAQPIDTVSPPLDEPPSRSSRLGPWIVLGSGAALVVTGAILYGVAYATYQEHEQFDNLNDLESWDSSVQGKAIAGDVLVGVGAAAAIGGLIWLLVQSRSRFRLSAGSARAGGLMLDFRGTF